jgi:serine/threonine protein kinase
MTRPGSTPPPSEVRVGDYRLLAKIGEGGMGVVHLAQAPGGQRVALKVLRPHIVGDDEARERLAREVASLRRVRSPRIAEVLDADPWGETPFVATRYVPGLSLHEHVKQEGLLGGEDLRLFAEGLAEAVLAVHSVGVLHRDIKPSNVLLEGRRPVLIDFGLARLADDPKLTVTGWLLGTPGYLAPEILYGEDATTASDVHAWAATVAFAATGAPPFGRGPAMAIMDRVRRGEHDLSGVPPQLLPLVRACLAADPADRPTFPAVLADLRPRDAAPGRGRSRRGTEDPTMPFVLATARTDDDPTDVLGQHTSRLGEARTVAATIADTVVDGRPAPGAAGESSAGQTSPSPVQQAARTSYLSPVPPAQPGPPPRAGTTGLARLQRGVLLLALLAGVTLAFALAPYLAVVGIGVAALAVRTLSWTVESAQERSWRRGRRWYDGPLAVFSAPWYLLVATGGTVVLLLWSAALAFLTGLGLLVFRAPVEPALLVMGAVLSLALWWGPGGRRLRSPTRSVLGGVTRHGWLGWLAVAATTTAVLVGAWTFASTGASWEPQPGPPWRAGTMLGDALRLL